MRRTAVALTAAFATAVLALPGQAYQRPGRTTRVSAGFDGSQAQDPVDGALGLSSWESAISADGRYIAFSSTAVNLVPGDTNGMSDIFVKDLVTGSLQMVSVASDGKQAVGACSNGQTGSSGPSISADGRYVAFSSCATNLAPGDTNLTWDGFVHDRKTRKTEMVTVRSDGKQPTLPAVNRSSHATSISPEGRYVGISSVASDLVPGDTNGSPDAFVFDRTARKVQRISVSSDEVEAASGSSSGTNSLSANGKFVVFTSTAANLVPGDTNNAIDAFVRDVAKGTTERISVRSGGAQALGPAGNATGTGGRTISADGRFVTFSSQSGGLVPADTNGVGLSSDFDIFVHDRLTHRTERVSVRSDGGQAADGTSPGAISLDGRYVVVSSSANNLVDFDTGTNGSSTTTVGPQPGDEDVFLYDRKFGTIEMLSVAPDGTEAKGHCKVTEVLSEDSAESFGPAVSADGRFVAFQSCAKNLVAGDTNGTRDEFVRDRGPHLGAATVTGRAGGAVTLSGWATFSGAVLASAADSATDGVADAAVSGAELIGGDVVYRPELGDLFLRLDVTQIPAVGVGLGGITPPGDPRVLYGFRFVANGATYEVRVHRAGANTTNPLDAAFGLFECTETLCTEVAALRGGYGTTGERIVVSVPLSAVTRSGQPLGEGGVLSSLRAYTGYGSYYGGATQVVDQLVLSTKPSVVVPGKSVTLTVAGTSKRASVTNGTFSASFPRSLFGRTTRVQVRTCLGAECRQSSYPVEL